jgi:hypothetical protein
VTPGRAGAAAIPYTVATEWRVSLAVYDGQGHLVRTLLAGTPRRLGSYSQSWDGLDRYGNALSAGDEAGGLLVAAYPQHDAAALTRENKTPRAVVVAGGRGLPGCICGEPVRTGACGSVCLCPRRARLHPGRRGAAEWTDAEHLRPGGETAWAWTWDPAAGRRWLPSTR